MNLIWDAFVTACFQFLMLFAFAFWFVWVTVYGPGVWAWRFILHPGPTWSRRREFIPCQVGLWKLVVDEARKYYAGE